MPTTTVRGIDLILVGSLGKETLSNDSFENLALGISGTTTIALTATDYTLTTDNQGDAMRMILVLTGTLTANVTVFVPAEGRVFVVDNRTTGAFTVTFTTATGSGFAVPQAERTFLYCDGTDVFPVGTGGGVGGGAPPDAPYLVSSAHSLLTGERVVTDTATVLWDHTTVGQSRATVPAASETAAGVLELATAAETQAGTDTTRAVTPAGLAAKVPSGTALSVARYAASGTALEAASGVLTTATTGQLVLGSNTFGLGAANLLVLEREGNTQLAVISSGVTGSAGSTLLLEGTSGTLSAPTPVLANGRLGVINFGGYDGGAFIITASCRVQASELWSGSARGSFLSFLTTFTGTTSPTERLRIDGQGNINTTRAEVTSGLQNGVVLRNGTGPSSDMPDAVQAWVADRNAIAGRASLHLRTENAQSYVLGDVCGIGTLCVMSSLGSGEIYRPLSVNGAALLVGQSSVQERPMGLLEPSWVVSTDATRTARLSLSAYDATAAREGLRLEADGSAARLGFYGGSAVAKPTVTGSRGGNAALASLLTALSSLGLVTDSSTA